MEVGILAKSEIFFRAFSQMLKLSEWWSINGQNASACYERSLSIQSGHGMDPTEKISRNSTSIKRTVHIWYFICLLYTSDAADE